VLRYTAPATDKQPYGSYRLDVFSSKANRRMVLYGKPALCQFIDLEVDNRVTEICERPLMLPGIRPAKVVDFWAACDGKPTFYLFLNPARPKANASWDRAYVQFQEWVAEHHAVIVEVDPGSFEGQRVRYDNWSVILQHLGGHRAFLTEELLNRCEAEVPRNPKLSQIEDAIGDVDAMLVRAAVFKLLSCGRLVCESLEKQPIHAELAVLLP
jgi:hypothetical protein